MSIDATLIGGPATGATIEVGDGTATLLVEGHGLPVGCVSRYSRCPSPHAFRFAGIEPFAEGAELVDEDLVRRYQEVGV